MNSKGGRIPSTRPPRRQALAMPAIVPIANAMTVDAPTRPSVQGSFEMISCPTGTPCDVTPNCPVSMFLRYSK